MYTLYKLFSGVLWGLGTTIDDWTGSHGKHVTYNTSEAYLEPVDHGGGAEYPSVSHGRVLVYSNIYCFLLYQDRVCAVSPRVRYVYHE